MTTLVDVRKRHITLMQTTLDILGHVLARISDVQATTLRDGSDGWTVAEVVGHLRDFDGFFHGRALQMRDQDYPNLPGYDPDALAVEHAYNRQPVAQAYAELVESRRAFIAFFNELTEAQWERAGVHPQRGHMTMTDAVMQVGLHDSIHIEQITRILRGG